RRDLYTAAPGGSALTPHHETTKTLSVPSCGLVTSQGNTVGHAVGLQRSIFDPSSGHDPRRDTNLRAPQLGRLPLAGSARLGADHPRERLTRCALWDPLAAFSTEGTPLNSPCSHDRRPWSPRAGARGILVLRPVAGQPCNQSQCRMPARGHRQLAAILAADIAGYSRLGVDEAGTVPLLGKK